MDLTGMSRREKFRYLKEKGFKVKATMKTAELDKLLGLDEPPKDQTPARGSRSRVPLGRHRQKMSVDHLNIPDNKVARWVNDVGNRIDDALNGGYEFVKDAKAKVGEDPLRVRGMGSAVNMAVGKNDDGTPIQAYLMVIDKDLYKEDQREKAKAIDVVDKAIKEGAFKSDYEGKYVPKGGIQYEPKG